MTVFSENISDATNNVKRVFYRMRFVIIENEGG